MQALEAAIAAERAGEEHTKKAFSAALGKAQVDQQVAAQQAAALSAEERAAQQAQRRQAQNKAVLSQYRSRQQARHAAIAAESESVQAAQKQHWQLDVLSAQPRVQARQQDSLAKEQQRAIQRSTQAAEEQKEREERLARIRALVRRSACACVAHINHGCHMPQALHTGKEGVSVRLARSLSCAAMQCGLCVRSALLRRKAALACRLLSMLRQIQNALCSPRSHGLPTQCWTLLCLSPCTALQQALLKQIVGSGLLTSCGGKACCSALLDTRHCKRCMHNHCLAGATA